MRNFYTFNANGCRWILKSIELKAYIGIYIVYTEKQLVIVCYIFGKPSEDFTCGLFVSMHVHCTVHLMCVTTLDILYGSALYVRDASIHERA